MQLERLTAISSVDGRYRDISEALVPYFSEYALIKSRLRVECEYFIALSHAGIGLPPIDEKGMQSLRRIVSDFTPEEAHIVKKIERDGLEGRPATNHDVKAVEYFLKDKLRGTPLEKHSEWIHFALTSEDINSVAYGLLLRDFFEAVYLGGPLLELSQKLESLSTGHAATAMLARTHGQPASPTTFGKEMCIFLERLRRQIDAFKRTTVLVKFAGATGNYNAHVIAAPDIDWQDFAQRFIESFNEEGIGKSHYMRVELNRFAPQIEPHDTYAEYFDAMRRVNTILIDLSQDMWRYISDSWLTQKPKEGEVGSSAMPHKVNPIDFENAEGNLGVANALFEHFSRKLPISRLQRDLSDSTVERVFGTALAHTIIGFRALVRGLGKVSVNETAMRAALSEHPEVLAEAIQTVLRKEGVAVPYEKLKALTRGKTVSLEDFAEFIDGLEIGGEVKSRLKALRPDTYIGLAEQIAKNS